MTSLSVPGTLLDTSCGSPHYCDPMVVSGEAYDGLKADVRAVEYGGIVIFSVLLPS